MALTIEKDYSPVLGGDVSIVFNKTDGTFWVSYPEDVIDDLLVKDKVYTMKEAQQLRDDSIKAFTQSRFFKRKVIAVRFMSSSAPLTERKGLGDGNPNRIERNGCTMGLDWAVYNEYDVNKRVVAGRESVGVKNRQTVYEPVYKVVVEQHFELLYASSYFKDKQHTDKLKPRQDAFRFWEPTHILDYSEEMEEYLKTTERSMEVMVERVSKFFYTNTEQFLLNVKSNSKLLG